MARWLQTGWAHFFFLVAFFFDFFGVFFFDLVAGFFLAFFGAGSFGLV